MHLLSLARAYIQPRTSFRKSQKVKKVPYRPRPAKQRHAQRCAGPTLWAQRSGLALGYFSTPSVGLSTPQLTLKTLSSRENRDRVVLTTDSHPVFLPTEQKLLQLGGTAQPIAEHYALMAWTLSLCLLFSLFFSFLALLFLSCFSCSFLFFSFFLFFFSTCVSQRDRRPHGSKKIWRIETMKKMMKKARKQKFHPRTCLEEDTARCIDTKTWTWTWTPPNRPGGFLFLGSFLKSSKKW